MGALAAERIKIMSTRSPWWCTAVIVVLGLAIGAFMGWVGNQVVAHPEQATDFAGLTPGTAAGGVSGIGVTVLMIMAALVVTSEYRFGIIRTTFQAVPHRATVITAKVAVVGIFGVVLTTVLSFGAIFLAKLVANDQAQRDLVLSTADQWREFVSIPIYAFLCVTLAIGIGVLVKQSAAAISLVILWPLAIENIVKLFGNVGRDIQAFLPFTNAQHFMSGSSGGVDFHWGPWGSLLYFALWVGAIFGAALFVVNHRDA